MLTAAEIAAYLGVTPGYVRKVIAVHQVEPVGKRGRAHLYRLDDITRHTGTRDRLRTTA